MSVGSLFRRLLFLVRRRQFDRDLADELRFHEDAAARHLEDSRDLSAADARAAARRRLGNSLRVHEQSRDAWVFAPLETFAQDVRHALRLMRRDPAFSFTALATLALGIGLNTAIFSVAYGVLWRPLPYPDPDRLVMISSAQQADTGVRTFTTWAPVSYDALREGMRGFEQLAAYNPIDGEFTGRGEPLQVSALEVSSNFFATLGAAPAKGRAFLSGSGAPDDDGSAVVSDRLWRASLHADPSVVGQSITIDGVPRTIVGVLPPDFRFTPLVGGGTAPETDVFLSARWPRNGEPSAFLFVMGRMAPDVTREQVRAELTTLLNSSPIIPAGTIAAAGEYKTGARALGYVTGLQEYATGSTRALLLILLGAVSFVLLIACVNVANLQMARLTARRGELSVRIALGAGRGRILRQLMTEAAVLSLAGAGLGVGLAQLAIGITLPLVPEALLPRIAGITIDADVLMFCLGLSLLATLVVGLVPAWRVGGTSSSATNAVQSSEVRTTGDRRGERMRTLLVASQIAMTLVLLVGAGLLIHSFVRLTSVSPGFDTGDRDGVVQTVRVTLPERGYDDPVRSRAFAREVLDRIQHLPGVTSASVINSAPFGRMFIQGAFEFEGLPEPTLSAGTPKIEADYFRTMGIPLLAGREFTADDTAGAPAVAIVSERIVREYFGGDPVSAIGRRLRLGVMKADGEWRTIVGVVADIRQQGLDQDVKPMIYAPFQQERDASFLLRFVSFVARTDAPGRVAEGIRTEIRRVAPDLPIADMQTMDEAVAASVAAPRFRTLLLALFAAAAMLIATCGLYGLMAYAVTQRRREIGVRMALGASRGDVLRLVLSRAIGVVAAGVIAGLVAAVGVTRVLRTFLFDVTPTDPLVFALVTLLLLSVGLAAAWIPARRATRIDPWKALRAD
jgi:putative ABC transport system permease protein